MNINNSPWPYIIIMRETNTCLCTLKTKKTFRIDVFCETFGHVFWGNSFRRHKKKATGYVEGALSLVFLFEVIFASLSAPPRKRRWNSMCVCVLFSSWKPPLRFFIMSLYKGYLFHVSKSQKKTACATGSTTLHFHALKIAGPRESSTSLYCFHALKTTMKTTKKYNTTYDIRFMIRIFCCQTSGHWEAKVGTDIERYHDFGSWTKARGGKDWKDCCWEGSRTGKGGMLDLLLNDLIWQAYFSHGWFNHQLGNPSTLNPYSRQKRRDL